MVQAHCLKKVIVITGPTGVGKTNISIAIAGKLKTEIINADASQFRRKLDIGTAKIQSAEMNNIKHHLIDIIDIEDEFSIKEYQMLTRDVIADLHMRKKIPILVGGSGLYINAALGDYTLDNVGRNYALEEMYANISNEELHQTLKKIDKDAYEKIHANNRRRVLRALDIAINTDKKISEKKVGNNLLYDALIISLTAQRDILYKRINERTKIMLQNGWIDEVQRLKNEDYDVSDIKDIGYKEIDQYLKDEIEFSDLIDMIQKKTRNYAKRQETWFKNKMNCQFISVDYTNINKTINETMTLINTFLNKNN